MIISRDLISHNEMFSDIYKIREIGMGCTWRWRARWSVGQRVTLMTRSLVEMPLAKAPEGEGTESTVVAGVDIAMNHHLQETNFTKEAYKKYFKDCMKSIKGKLEEQRPEKVKPFMTGGAEQIKCILANFRNY
ncbi:Translationally-controlled tumor protein [Heterocephalus glaber]|uniref:Translationally-controlled tumor protein n=1 Tax=Heterocephalus glaber TaxID=10181 RepID=G5C1F3_HETGA|nr:Translationally-controlled tumor protein [Heterocephalus glaber]